MGCECPRRAGFVWVVFEVPEASRVFPVLRYVHAVAVEWGWGQDRVVVDVV